MLSLVIIPSQARGGEHDTQSGLYKYQWLSRCCVLGLQSRGWKKLTLSYGIARHREGDCGIVLVALNFLSGQDLSQIVILMSNTCVCCQTQQNPTAHVYRGVIVGRHPGFIRHCFESYPSMCTILIFVGKSPGISIQVRSSPCKSSG